MLFRYPDGPLEVSGVALSGSCRCSFAQLGYHDVRMPPGVLAVFFLVSSRLGFSPTLVELNSFLSVWLLDYTITASGLPRLALAGYCGALLGSFCLFGVSLDSRRHFGAALGF